VLKLRHIFLLLLALSLAAPLSRAVTAPLPAGPATAAPAAAAAATCVSMTPWVFDFFDELPGVPEPSGLCYCPPRNTLFVVDDGASDRPAGLYEIDLDAKVLAGLKLGKDLEGVCWCADDGLLYVCDESGEMVHIVDPQGLKLLDSFHVDATYQGQAALKPGGNGFEGIEYIPAVAPGDSGFFVLLNQDDPTCLLKMEYSAVRARKAGADVPISMVWPLEQINSGELYYDARARELWVVHAWVNVIEILDVATMQPVRWEVCPGCAQEAVAQDGEGRLWIGYDSGGMSRYVLRAEE
jgi:hypothetical protein